MIETLFSFFKFIAELEVTFWGSFAIYAIFSCIFTVSYFFKMIFIDPFISFLKKKKKTI